jgi:hypothetical protein
MQRLGLVVAALVVHGTALGAQMHAPATFAGASEPSGGWQVQNRSLEKRREGDREFIHLDERAGGGFAWSPSLAFSDGEIEFDVRGRDVFQKSFVGVAFHIAGDTAMDVVYLRPFNFRSADSTRHAHAVQFTAEPGFPWERLRVDHPGVFEKAVPAEIEPTGWIHVRIAVHGAEVQVYLAGAATPALSVTNPSMHRSGGVGYFVGDVSDGDFANLKVVPASR